MTGALQRLRLVWVLLTSLLCLTTGTFASIRGYDAGEDRFIAAKTPPKIDNAVNAVEDFLGGQGKIIKNADGDTILMHGDKKIRFDVKDPHGDKPHFHLEKQTPSGKWKDAGPEHRYYFKEDGQ
jgi:endonuclease YncB( thermonuclease family)